MGDFLALQVVLVTEVLLEISAKLLDLLDLQDRKEALEILASHAKMVRKENKVKVETKDHKVNLDHLEMMEELEGRDLQDHQDLLELWLKVRKCLDLQDLLDWMEHRVCLEILVQKEKWELEEIKVSVAQQGKTD